MRVVIDLQGAQASNKNRGIGRYSLAFAQALVRQRGEHDVVVMLNGLFSDTIGPIRSAFSGLLPPEKIVVWTAPGPLAEADQANATRRAQALTVRKAFLAKLKPDWVLVTSLFEGFGDDAAVSVDKSFEISTAVVLYDLIPLLHKNIYLSNPAVEQSYRQQLEQIRQADILLAISESSRQEALMHLGISDDRVTNISTDCDAHFSPCTITQDDKDHLHHVYGIQRPYVMYTGGIDHRKNIDRLIRAYARLPQDVRQQHQLVVVCKAHPGDIQALEAQAFQAGLAKDELIMTGFVPEQDLVILYNACKLFVFPSWHEGFGLPALEAMRCAKAVIASNTSSLPEVVGLQEALFDPYDESDMAAKMLQVLEDAGFRKRLEQHGWQQGQRFNWDHTAQRTWTAMLQSTSIRKDKQAASSARHRLAYLSPLPPERSGISDYSAQLLRALVHWYDIDVIVDQSQVTDDWIVTHCAVRDVQWFSDHHGEFDRVIYHMGNSHFHQHMFDLLHLAPGVVVLHDFFLSGVLAHRQFNGGPSQSNVWTQAMQNSHGYVATKASLEPRKTTDAIWQYPCNLPLLQSALGVIVHSEHSKQLVEQWYGSGASQGWEVIPLLREPAVKTYKSQARKALNLPENAFVVCSFGLLGPHKLNQNLLHAFVHSSLAKSPNCHLVFVGENHEGDYGKNLEKQIHMVSGKERIHITGWTDAEVFAQYLAAADIAVQLRTLSRGETSAAVLDCMNHGLATIVNANGSMADLDPRTVWKLPDQFEQSELINALETLWKDASRRQALGDTARQTVVTRHAPQTCAEQYKNAIENFYLHAKGVHQLMESSPQTVQKPEERVKLAMALAKTFPPEPRQRQLLIDVSELVQRDAKTGIQRVTRAVLHEWLHRPQAGWSVQPVYAVEGQLGYRYAQKFTSAFLGMTAHWTEDVPVDAWPGDVFIGLDLQPHIVPAQQAVLDDWFQRGVTVKFVVYDLLPILMPEAFVQGATETHEKWLQCVARYNGFVCISQAVASDLRNWLNTQTQQPAVAHEIDWFHLGADVDHSAPSKGMPEQAFEVLNALRQRPSFLMVGTLEPRKGYAQVLQAFEHMWQEGVNINLVIVGKIGWKVDALVEQLKMHSQLGNRLIWLEGVSDEFLEKIYQSSSCLIAASQAEGFGLPLIEAAQYQLPILARDIPVFREVAGAHADYFQGTHALNLAEAIKSWLEKHKQGIQPQSKGMPILSWQQSVQQLSKALKISH